METLILLFDTIALMVVVFFSLKNDRLPEGAPEIGFFRIKAPEVSKSPETNKGPQTRKAAEPRPAPNVVQPMRRSRRL